MINDDVTLVSQVRVNPRFTLKYSKRVFSVKVFTGNPETDHPEFHEYERRSESIEDFLQKLDSRYNMIKIDIRNTNDSLLSNMFRIIQCEARRLNVPEEKCNMAVLRITGPMWRFPMHYDAGHQIVIHLQGEKRWYWISNGT